MGLSDMAWKSSENGRKVVKSRNSRSDPQVVPFQDGSSDEKPGMVSHVLCPIGAVEQCFLTLLPQTG